MGERARRGGHGHRAPELRAHFVCRNHETGEEQRRRRRARRENGGLLMSLEIILIPVAMAAYAAWQARAEAGAQQCQVETRWRHSGLLMQALHDVEAANISGT